jgi:hypothetical protein
MTEEEQQEKIGTIDRYIPDRKFGFLKDGHFFHVKDVPKEIHPFL